MRGLSKGLMQAVVQLLKTANFGRVNARNDELCLGEVEVLKGVRTKIGNLDIYLTNSTKNSH